MSDAKRKLEFGNKYPYDCGVREGDTVQSPDDWSFKAARGILADLCDRRGVKSELNEVDMPIRIEIVASLAAIIREAATKGEYMETLLKASSKCPICGADTPHTHDQKTVNDYRESQVLINKRRMEEHQKIEARRQEVDAKFLAEMQRRIDAEVKFKERYESMCPNCRIARVGDDFIKETIGTLVIYDYGWDVSHGMDVVTCQKCGECLWDRS